MKAAAGFPSLALRLIGVAAMALSLSAGAQQVSTVRSADLIPSDRLAHGNGPALHALLDGRMDEAQEILYATIARTPEDATAHQLLCRVFYAQDQAESAIRECELAAADTPAAGTASAEARLWLGRAYGMKARQASPLAAFALARKVHASFEAAAQADPASVAALNDLGEYYVDAPSIVGGGDDKARALALRIMPEYPAAAHRILALLAQSNKELSAAESEFKLAISSAQSSTSAGESAPEAWIDLAHFYQTQHRADDAVSTIRAGLAADRTRGPVLVDAASILTASQREPLLAERCLRDYLAGHNRSDAAPAFKVHLQLSQMLAARGQSVEASKEEAAAAALAPAFKRAPRGAQGI